MNVKTITRKDHGNNKSRRWTDELCLVAIPPTTPSDVSNWHATPNTLCKKLNLAWKWRIANCADCNTIIVDLLPYYMI